LFDCVSLQKVHFFTEVHSVILTAIAQQGVPKGARSKIEPATYLGWQGGSLLSYATPICLAMRQPFGQFAQCTYQTVLYMHMHIGLKKMVVCICFTVI
jgi:hypothetical protein